MNPYELAPEVGFEKTKVLTRSHISGGLGNIPNSRNNTS